MKSRISRLVRVCRFRSTMKILSRSTLVWAILMSVVAGGTLAVIGDQATPYGPWPGIGTGVVVLLLTLRRPLRRWRVSRRPLGEANRQWLNARIPLYQRLDADGRARFERDVQFVLDEYSFEGVQGVDASKNLRLAVAAGVACLLHGRPEWDLPGTTSFLFYPDRFDDDYFGGDYADYDGMAHEQGPTILTASSVEHSWDSPDDGDNVVLHELAHHFDFDNINADGVPSLVAPESAQAWQALVKNEIRKVRHGQSILRPYAAEAPSEFFAVATEVFFEQPNRMHDHHPDLFGALCAFYQIDPRTGEKPASSTSDVVVG